MTQQLEGAEEIAEELGDTREALARLHATHESTQAQLQVRLHEQGAQQGWVACRNRVQSPPGHTDRSNSMPTRVFFSMLRYLSALLCT